MTASLISRVQVWGVLNVTPDSFSDGGTYLDPARAVARAEELWSAGADVIDVGGESTRPAGNTYGDGYSRVTADEEVRRVVPVVARIAGTLPEARISVDTTKAQVAAAAIAAGAHIVNDVSGGLDPQLLAVVARTHVQLVLMHNRGRGEVTAENAGYRDVVAEVRAELLEAVERARAAGVDPERIWIDPGIGFAKTAQQSLELLVNTERLVETGYPVLVGPSRKSFIAEYSRARGGEKPTPAERVGGTAAALTMAVLGGARAVRVHDLPIMAQAVDLATAMRALREAPRD
jgi:dihydropteroate synthase